MVILKQFAENTPIDSEIPLDKLSQSRDEDGPKNQLALALQK